ncbi:MAG: hypothetical protein KDB74_02115 [Flavobacteriales bacterium]|nr:hypothetical protein [Flavobacteriales bacterium]
MNRKMKNLKPFFLLSLCQISIGVMAQSTLYSSPGTNGNWSNAARWSNGFPDMNKDAVVGQSLLTASKVDVDFECRDLTNTILAQTLRINSGVTLTVYGDLTLSRFSNFTNNGTLIIHGDVIDNLGSVKLLTIQGGVTSVSGLTFPNITID